MVALNKLNFYSRFIERTSAKEGRSWIFMNFHGFLLFLGEICDNFLCRRWSLFRIIYKHNNH